MQGLKKPVGDSNNDRLCSSDEGGLNTHLTFEDQYERMITRQLAGFISD